MWQSFVGRNRLVSGPYWAAAPSARTAGAMRPRRGGLLRPTIIALLLAPSIAFAAERSHGLSTFGDLKYAAGFKHFDYVNPDAPKGGQMRGIGISASLTFDSFNPFIVRGTPAKGYELNYESLMVRAYDEPDAVYGLIADWVEVADDKRSVTFRIRPEAKWADGSAITSADCAFSLAILKEKGDPSYTLSLKDVASADVIDSATVRYRFTGDNLRDLPGLVATLPVLSKAYWEPRKFDEPSLDVPLTSGPYKVGKFTSQSFVTYERRADYWGRDLAVNAGRWNFDLVKFDYYSDRTAGLQAFFAGDLDFREEFSSRDWATGYNVPAVTSGKIRRELPREHTPSGTQGFFFNLRLPKFADPRVREALDLAFDFEWTRKNLFFGAYERTQSYFENSNMKAMATPSPGELALLDPLRADLPPATFGEAVVPAKSDGSGGDRANFTKARDILKSAGFTVKDGKLVDASGTPFKVEFLLDEPTFERILNPYVKNLQVLGVDASIRTIDPTNYEERQRRFDFDVVSARYPMRLTPGIELRNYFSSAAADSPNSANLGGIKSKAIDALIEKVAGAKSREELVTAVRALDRALRAGRYWVPEWYNPVSRFAFWDRFAWPEKEAPFAHGPGDSMHRGVVDLWWYDPARDAKLASK